MVSFLLDSVALMLENTHQTGIALNRVESGCSQLEFALLNY